MSKTNTKKAKADSSRERILDTAARLFSEHGYATVSLRAIATEAGMQAGSLYYHFDSKEAIVIEVLKIGVQRVLDKVAQAIAALPESASAAELINTGIRSHLSALFEYSAYSSANVCIHGQLPEQVQKPNREMRQQYDDLWSAILSRAANTSNINPEVNLTTYRALLIGSLNATLEWFDPSRGDVNTLATQYSEILLHGLLAQKAHYSKTT